MNDMKDMTPEQIHEAYRKKVAENWLMTIGVNVYAIAISGGTVVVVNKIIKALLPEPEGFGEKIAYWIGTEAIATLLGGIVYTNSKDFITDMLGSVATILELFHDIENVGKAVNVGSEEEFVENLKNEEETDEEAKVIE